MRARFRNDRRRGAGGIASSRLLCPLCGLAAMAVSVSLGSLPSMARAAGLTTVEATRLSQAVEADDVLVVDSIVLAAIARAPERAGDILEGAMRLAPDHANRLVELAGDTFPGLAEPIAAAASAARNDPTGRGQSSPAASDTIGGEFSLAAAHSSGKDSRTLSNLGVKLHHDAAPWRNDLDLTFDYGRSRGLTTSQRLQIRGKSRYELSERWYGYGLAEYLNNRFGTMIFEFAESVGAGYRIVDGEEVTLDLEAGPSLRQRKIRSTGERQNITAARIGAIVHWFLTDTTSFSNETSVLIARDHIDVGTRRHDDQSAGRKHERLEPDHANHRRPRRPPLVRIHLPLQSAGGNDENRVPKPAGVGLRLLRPFRPEPARG